MAVPATATTTSETTAVKPTAPASPLVEIKCPIVGTFYSASSPDVEVFVKVGSRVSADTVVCIVEAMKVFNRFQRDVAERFERSSSRTARLWNTAKFSSESKPADPPSERSLASAWNVVGTMNGIGFKCPSRS